MREARGADLGFNRLLAEKDFAKVGVWVPVREILWVVDGEGAGVDYVRYCACCFGGGDQVLGLLQFGGRVGEGGHEIEKDACAALQSGGEGTRVFVGAWGEVCPAGDESLGCC